MVRKRFRLDDGAEESEGDVDAVHRNENHHAVQVTWTREEAILSHQTIQMNLGEKIERQQLNGRGAIARHQTNDGIC